MNRRRARLAGDDQQLFGRAVQRIFVGTGDQLGRADEVDATAADSKSPLFIGSCSRNPTNCTCNYFGLH